MAVKSRSVSVATTATRLDTVPSSFGEAATSFAFYNVGASTIYFGGSDVTTANGSPVAASAWSPGIDLAPGEGIFGIVASGTVEARVVETGI